MTDRGIGDLALPLRRPQDLEPLIERIGDARYVLLGEASHGTSEYYRWRADLSRTLIADHGFSFVAVEGDWPDCYAIDRCVEHDPQAPEDPEAVLERFDRWPTWMWANTDVLAFALWLRDHNGGREAQERVGFYGLDVYSLWDSLRAVIDYLVEHEPEHVGTAMRTWRCFEPYGEDPQRYALDTRLVPTSCEQDVVELLSALLLERAPNGDAATAADGRFDAEQNAAVAVGAERYYRAMVRGGPDSWNVRDHHMADTLDRLMDHHGPGAKAIVWAHNTHVGDARATDMAEAGMVNVGQLVRERHGDAQTVLVGFSGHAGEVIAASAWGAPARRMEVPPAAGHSVEALLHGAGCRQALFIVPEDDHPEWMTTVRDHRAIGVVYDPRRERRGNYVPTVLADRYDALIHVDDTTALEPLRREPAAPVAEPETFPSGR